MLRVVIGAFEQISLIYWPGEISIREPGGEAAAAAVGVLGGPCIPGYCRDGPGRAAAVQSLLSHSPLRPCKPNGAESNLRIWCCYSS